MSFQIKAEILGNMDSFARAMRKSEKQLQGLEKVTKSISTAMNGAFVGIALAGLNMLWDGIIDVTKAAAQEAKSVALLEKAMTNSWHSTQQMNAENEKFIKTSSYMSGIADDKLRPAYAKIVSVTKDAKKAQDAFSLSLDIAAFYGKDINVVSQAMAKYLGGNKKALDKLIPGLSNVGNKMQFLRDKTAGAAAAAGENMPFERLQLVMDDISETIGSYLLPYFQQFADWATGPEGQAIINDFFKGISAIMKRLTSPEGKARLDAIIGGIEDLTAAFASMFGLMDDNKGILDMIFQGADPFGFFSGGNSSFNTTGIQMPGLPTGQPVAPKPPTVVVNVNPITGASVTKLLNGEAAKRGTSVNRMFTG